MAFSEELKTKVRESSAFRCARCQNIGIEVHHLISQKDGGSDTFENAAPLCPNCHTWFGGNPEKRKEITQMRNWWYKKVRDQYPNNDANYELLGEINTKLEHISIGQENNLEDLKDTLKTVAIEAIEHMTVGTARITASGIANATASPSSSFSASPSFPPLIPTQEEIEEAGDRWIQQQIDIERGK